ncbi:MAG: hypothetical protein JSS32_04605 [Verrucomicrobia bacterium]|nr:hypothetical protein [Verrucomicrobiota bacterium]
MTISLIALMISGILFLVLAGLATLPFFPALAVKIGAMPKPSMREDFLKNPRGLSAAFRIDAKEKMHSGDFSPKDPIDAERLYVSGNAFISPKSNLVSLACDKSGVIGSDAKISEWVDAHDSLEFGERCMLGSYATCHGRLLIGRGSTFKNLHGSPIQTAGLPTKPPAKSKQKTTSDTAWFIGHLWVIVPQSAKVKENIVSEKSVWIKQGAKIQGSVNSLQDLKLDEDVTIEGDLFAEGDIEIGANCTIQGNLFAKGEIHLDKGTKIGAKEALTTVSGVHNVRIGENVQIYGSVTTHGLGTVSI